MRALFRGFSDELLKTAKVDAVVARAIGAPGSPLRKAMLRAALLGAGTSGVQAALSPHEPGEKRHLVRNALAGAAAGVVAGRAFPAWFGRASMTPSEGA